MSFIKYRLKDVASDFGVTPRDIAEIIGKYGEKPKSNTQVLTDQELNVVFDYMTQKNQISSLEQVFAVKPREKAKPQAPQNHSNNTNNTNNNSNNHQAPAPKPAQPEK